MPDVPVAGVLSKANKDPFAPDLVTAHRFVGEVGVRVPGDERFGVVDSERAPIGPSDGRGPSDERGPVDERVVNGVDRGLSVSVASRLGVRIV